MFHIVNPEFIKQGLTTDVYFERSLEILENQGINPEVTLEVRAKGFPRDYEWAVLAGVEELAELFTNVKVDSHCLREGEIFYPGEPVLTITGNYLSFGDLETAALGFICQASGIATAAAHCKKAAGERSMVHFGARRMHPAITHMIDRAAYLGGCDAVSVISSAKFLGLPATGTMPHALILIIGDTVEAARMFNEVIDKDVKRVVLIDTFEDEKFAAMGVADALGKDLFGIRFDTPGSRRGNFFDLISETKWELALRGHDHVKIFVSGGIDLNLIEKLNPLVDSYGIGTYISSAPVIDFSMDIIEMNGKPFSKRGKESGAKALVRCSGCGRRQTIPLASFKKKKCGCGGKLENLLQPLVRQGKVVADLPSPQEIHARVLAALETL